MSKLFMYGTSLEGIEQLAVECNQSLLPTVEFLDIPDMRPTTIYFINRVRSSMLIVPNFQPRRSGIVINNYFNCEGGVKDCNCNVINVSKGLDKCGYMGSDFKVNVDKKKYKDLVMECFGKIKSNSLRNRLKALSKNFKGEVFLTHRHKEKFYNFLQDQDIDINYISSRFIAILFLFTADERLWKASKNLIKLNGFNFEGICPREINTDGYALYQTAKTISTGKECIRINELADKELIDDYIFKAIINSALINRYGAELFLINK